MKHLLNQNHISFLNLAIELKKIPVNLEQSTINAFKQFFRIYKNQYNRDCFKNLLKEFSILLRILKRKPFKNNIKNKLTSIQSYLDRYFEELNEIEEDIYLNNEECNALVLKFIENGNKLKDDLNNLINYLDEINNNEYKSKFETIKKNCETIKKFFDNLKDSKFIIMDKINEIIREIMFKNVLPYIKATILLYINNIITETKKNNVIYPDNNNNILNIESEKEYDWDSYVQFQKLVLNEGTPDDFERNANMIINSNGNSDYQDYQDNCVFKIIVRRHNNTYYLSSLYWKY